jgi:NAD(P)-dependent dehydrogenase (short-subunit alcohol dehydrogenase family)
VFGGTGFLGPAVVEALMADGHTVTIFNRGVTNAELFPRVEKLRGFRSAEPNDQDLSGLSRRHFDVVIDVWPNDPDVVASAAEFMKDRTNHYLFVSSVGAYDHKFFAKPDMIVEDTPLQPCGRARAPIQSKQGRERTPASQNHRRAADDRSARPNQGSSRRRRRRFINVVIACAGWWRAHRSR